MTFVIPSLAEPAPLRDIDPPIPFSLYPSWMIFLSIFSVLGLIVLLVWSRIFFSKKRRHPTPGEDALDSLKDLQSRMTTLSPHDFGIDVSAILRRYVQKEYGLSITTQTSMEFLASIRENSIFSSEEKIILGKFLETADLFKFSRTEAKQEDTTGLLLQAEQLVHIRLHSPAQQNSQKE